MPSSPATAVGAPTAQPLPWQRIVALGTLGGIALIAMEMLILPSGLGRAEMQEVFVIILPQWIATGIGIAGLTLFLEDRMTPPWLAAALAAFAVATSATISLFRQLARGVDILTSTSSLGANAPPLATFFYNLWVILFFGGLFALACALSLRAERTRSLLARTEIERSRTEAMLEEAQLRTLKGHVDPAFLLRVISDIERRYATDDAAADRLLDRLVAFLRLAMPGIRSEISTLDAEIALAHSYAELWSDLDPMRVNWKVRIDTPVPRLPIPPLLLLPVLDQWMASAGQRTHGELVVRLGPDAVTISLTSASAMSCDWMPETLAYRLRVGLGSVCGDTFELEIRDAMAPGLPALSLTLPLPSPEAMHSNQEVTCERH